jgi:hypothetical protein
MRGKLFSVGAENLGVTLGDVFGVPGPVTGDMEDLYAPVAAGEAGWREPGSVRSHADHSL